MSLNRVVLVGRLTKDPDLRYTPNGVAVANFTMAINRPFCNQQGNNEADFISCVTWRKTAESLANYMRKGSQIGIDGRLQSRTYEDQSGKTVFVTEAVAESVQFLESKNSAKSGGQTSQSQNNYGSTNGDQAASGQNNTYGGGSLDIKDDDLPF